MNKANFAHEAIKKTLATSCYHPLTFSVSYFFCQEGVFPSHPSQACVSKRLICQCIIFHRYRHTVLLMLCIIIYIQFVFKFDDWGMCVFQRGWRRKSKESQIAGDEGYMNTLLAAVYYSLLAAAEGGGGLHHPTEVRLKIIFIK